MTTINLNSQELQQKLNHVAQRMGDATPLMQRISLALLDETEQNFASQGRPRWAGLSVSKKGKLILQDSGQLAASIDPTHGKDFAAVGSNKVYAPIHQFGGKTRPHVIRPKTKKALAFGGKVFKQVNHPGSTIPARPFLPMDKNGFLQKEAEHAVNDVVGHFWQRIFD